MRLRPHHLIDIYKSLGNGREVYLLQSNSNGHSQPLVVRSILDDPEQKIELICENDDICKNCRHLQKDNSCVDMLQKLEPPVSKQLYNDNLDKKLFATLEISPGYMTTAVNFLQLVLENEEDIVPMATHPGGEEEFTRNGIRNAGEVLKNKLS